MPNGQTSGQGSVTTTPNGASISTPIGNLTVQHDPATDTTTIGLGIQGQAGGITAGLNGKVTTSPNSTTTSLTESIGLGLGRVVASVSGDVSEEKAYGLVYAARILLNPVATTSASTGVMCRRRPARQPALRSPPASGG